MKLVDHQRAAIEEIVPKGKLSPFMKVTFMTQNERWIFTEALNATKALMVSLFLQWNQDKFVAGFQAKNLKPEKTSCMHSMVRATKSMTVT